MRLIVFLHFISIFCLIGTIKIAIDGGSIYDARHFVAPGFAAAIVALFLLGNEK